MDWKSAVSYNARSMTKATREVLDQLDVVYTRDSTYTAYSRFMVVMPLPEKLAYTFIFKIHHPNEFSIQYYDAKPSHSGYLTFMEIKNYQQEDVSLIKEILKRLVAYFERPPWKFTRGQRLMHGYFIPEFRKAKKAWALFDCLYLTEEEKSMFKASGKT